MAWEIGAIEYDPLFVPGEDELPGAGGDFSGGEFPGDQFSGGAVPAFSKAHKWFILGKFFLDSGTEYDAALPVTHPDYLYEGRVLQWGFLDRSIPVPTGLPQVGDCRIRMADTDRKWRDLLSHQTPRRRFIELRWCVENRSESEFPPFGTFEIKDVEFTAGDLTIIGRDVHFAWVFKKFPNLINRTNFPDLITGLDEAQMPVINGIVVSRPDNPQGVIPLPPISPTRWGLAAHPVYNVVAIYRRFSGEGGFVLVDPSEYTVTQDPPIIIEDIEYNLTFIDFYLEQDEGVEVRADVEGINYRGPFFGMPEVFAGSDGPLRNPVDFLINLLYVMLKSETEFPAFNIQSFVRVRNQFESLLIDFGSLGNLPYFCDGAITETLTCGEILARVLTSFELDLYCNRFGEFELNLTTGTDPSRPVFDDTFRIIRNSVRQRLANPTFNRIRFRFERHYGEDEWGSNEVFNNLPDQLALGKIEEDTVDLWFVRDFFTAQDVIRRRAEWLALGSFRIELDMPAPEVRNDIELAKLFGVTHYGGLELGGYVNAEFKTTGITTDLDEFKTTVRGVLRVPQQIHNIRPGAISGTGTGSGSGLSGGSGGSAGSSSGGESGGPPVHGCPCVPSEYIAAESVEDLFDRADGPGFQSGSWREVAHDPALANDPFNPNNTWPSIGTLRILSNAMEFHRPKHEVGMVYDSSTAVGAIRMDVPEDSNWYVQATWGSDARIPMTIAPSMVLAAPISQLNPTDTTPNELEVSAFTFYCQRASATTYEFRLGDFGIGGTYSNMGSLITKTTSEFGPGHTYALRVVCNNLGTCTVVQGLIDGVVETEVGYATSGNKPAGRPGILDVTVQPEPATLAASYMDSFCAIADWSAEQLI